MMESIEGLDADLQSVGAHVVSPNDPELETVEADSDAVELDLVVGPDGVQLETPGLVAPRAAEAAVEGTRTRIRFEDLPGNEVHALLARLDDRLSPARGLRRLNESGALAPVTERCRGRSLLIVHGTFSNSETIVRNVALGDPEFLKWARAHYAHVLTFDYPSLSQQAIASAMDLARLTRTFADAEVDVVSHSQGGLVTRYWLEMLDRNRAARARAVFVAGTLGGTSLAAPRSLKNALAFLADVGWVLRKGAEVAALGVPLFGAVASLVAIVEKTLKVLSMAPVADVGVAIVPGFVGMSRAGTNAELRALRAGVDGLPPGYFAVTGDFEPTDPAWKFWKKWQTRIANGLADRVFDGRNDLVVDLLAQTSLSDSVDIAGDGRVLPYHAKEQHVHHTNYFQQARTLEFIGQRLGRP